VRGFEHGWASIGIKGQAATIQSERSIADLTAKEIVGQAFGSAGKPELFGIIGGPPCPDFSVGGKNKGHEGDRGCLSQTYVDHILEIEPAFFLFENVPGLLRTAKHQAFLTHLLTQLETKYDLDLRVVNALEYGVPQDRERLIIVGRNSKWLKRVGGYPISPTLRYLLMDAGKGCKHPITHHWMPWTHYRLYPDAKEKYAWPDACPFGSDPARPEGIPDRLMAGPAICDVQRLAALPNGMDVFRPYSGRFSTVPEGQVDKKCFKRLHRWRYSPAAAYGNNEVHLHPTQPRRLTVREVMQIQALPEQFALPADMPLSTKFKTIANGVPVHLAEAMARSLMDVTYGSRP
jgi:DNA (cytosine-5)-methyltransferase 1